MVSNFGQIKNVRSGKILKTHKVRGGYIRVNLLNGAIIHFMVHRLVWEAFNGPIPKGFQINHLNEDKTDNRLCNLALVTPSENINYGTRNQKIERCVNQFDLNGNLVCTWKSIRKAQTELNYIRNGQISACCSGKRKTAHGFIWRYADYG